jgi:hypothetical protein
MSKDIRICGYFSKPIRPCGQEGLGTTELVKQKHAVWYKFTDVSEEPTAYFFKAGLLPH